jgi:hypothetical protein
MGKIITPTYIVIHKDQLGTHTVIWHTKLYGRPNVNNLENWRKRFNDSMKIHGCNYHVSKSLGFLLHVSEAEIRNQKTGITVCAVKAPLFESI